VRENTKRVAEALEELGAQVVEVELPWTEELGRAAMAHLGFLMGSEIAEAVENSRELLTPYAIEFGEYALTVGPAGYVRAIRTAGEQYKPLGELLERNGCVPKNAFSPSCAAKRQEKLVGRPKRAVVSVSTLSGGEVQSSGHNPRAQPSPGTGKI